MLDDPIVAEVRAIREKLAARFNFDVGAIVEDAMKRQGKDGRKVVSRPAKRPRRRGAGSGHEAAAVPPKPVVASR